MRMKVSFILLFIAFSVALVNGQENPNVELPQFVITGKEAYEFPPLEKQKPELVSTVSEQFFKPVYSPDELEVKDFSEPTKRNGEFLDSVKFVNGEAEFLIGNNYLPSLSATYRLPMESSLFSANINAVNQRAYLENADRSKFGARLFYNYIISDSSSFLPFSKFRASAVVENESYKLFASPVPDFNRQFLHGNLLMSMQNISSTRFNYDVTIEDAYLNMKSDSLKENIFKINGYSKYSAKIFDFSLFGKFHLLNSTFDPLSSEQFAFIQMKGMFGFQIGNFTKTNFGFEYSKLDSNNSIFPYMAAAFQFGRGFSFFAEYHPTSVMLTQQDLVITNRYYTPNVQLKNIFYSITSLYSFSLKYEYERMFEVSGGLALFSTPNYPYFMGQAVGVNSFQMDTVEAQSASVFAKLHLFAGKYGFFGGEIIYQQVIDTAGNSVPNITPLTLNFTYGLFVTHEISLTASMMYYSPAFLNFANKEKGKDYFNITLKGEMNIAENLFAQIEARNILNRKNEIWKNYLELPLSIAAGLKIIW